MVHGARSGSNDMSLGEFFWSLLVIYVYYGVCMPQGITDRPGLPEWCTNHSDSVLFVTSILIVATSSATTRRAA